MNFAAWTARMSAPAEGAEGSVRSHLERAARGSTKGAEAAQRQLVAPAFPDALDYLWGRFLTLHTMRREGMSGLAALVPSDIQAANAGFGWALEPEEWEALHAIDVSFRHPDSVTVDE